MSAIEQIKEKDLLVYIQKTLGESGKTEPDGTRFHSGKGDKTPSLLVYKDQKRGYYDFSLRKGGGTVIDFCMNHFDLTLPKAIEKLKEEFGIKDEKKEFKKSPKRKDLLENFENYRMKTGNSGFARFLQTRGLNFDQIKDNKDKLSILAKEFGFSENNYLSDKTNKDFIIFPCLNDKKKVIGAKLRRIDGQKIPRGQGKESMKEVAISGGKNGLLYSDIDKECVLITEGPCDYIILKFLGYKSVVANLGGVSSSRDQLKYLLKDCKKIVTFYDNDPAGRKANMLLAKDLNRPINEIVWPEIDGKEKFDVNDLFKMGHGKDSFDKLIKNSKLSEVSEEDDDEDNLIIEQDEGYYVIQAFKDDVKEIKITNFKIEIEDIIEFASDGNTQKILVLKIFNKNKTVFGEFSPKDVSDVKNFKTIIKGLETSFSTYDMKPSALEGLLRFIHIGIDIKSTKVIDKKGYISEYDCWVFDEGIVYDQKFLEFNELNVVDIGPCKLKSVLNNRKGLPFYQDDDYFDENIIENIIPDFRYLFNGKQGDLVLGFLMASLFVNNLKKILKPFPILFVSGKKGSGKTMAINHALRTLGLEDSAFSAEEDNVFIDQFNLSEISSLPVWSDEFKNRKKTKEKNGFYKTIFDRNGTNKGTLNKGGVGSKSLKIENYDINGTFILSGEQTPIDDALFSRICLINVTSRREGENIYQDIIKRSSSYSSVFRMLLENNNFDDLCKEYEKIYNSVKKILIKKHSIEKRILDVYLPVISGFFFYNTIFLKKDLLLDEEWFISIKKIIDSKIKDENENDLVNEFFEVINNLYVDSGYNSINYSDEFIKITVDKNTQEKSVQVFYVKLFDCYQKSQKFLSDKEINKSSLKRDMLNEYGAIDSTMRIGGGALSKSLKFKIDRIPSNLKIIVKNIQDNPEKPILANGKIIGKK